MDPAAAAGDDAAAASEAPALHLVWDHDVSSGSLDADSEALVVGDRTPAAFQGVDAFGALAAVSSGRSDAAFEALVVESGNCVVSFWVHTVVVLAALDADFEVLDCTPALWIGIDAAWAAGEQRRGRAAWI